MTTETAQVVRFSCELPPKVLRRNTATVARDNPKPGQSRRRAIHWSDRAKAVREYQEQVWIAGYEALAAHMNRRASWPAWEKAKLTLVWKAASVLPDADNALSSLKALIDVLKSTGPRPLGIFRDDSPDCLEVVIRCVKVEKRTLEGVDVEVTKL